MPSKNSTSRDTWASRRVHGRHASARLLEPFRQARVVAVCDAVRLPENGVLRGVAGNIKKSGDIRLGTRVKVYREFDELLADRDLELVDICTPTTLHPAQAIASLRAGKNVLCEKPLAQNSARRAEGFESGCRGKDISDAGDVHAVLAGLGVAEKSRCRKNLRRGAGGEFPAAFGMPAWSAAGTHTGGALFDLHIHDTDFVNFLFGRPAKRFFHRRDRRGRHR